MPVNDNPAIPYDSSSISPSAYALLLMKRNTAIPYAREAANLLDAQIARIKASETPGTKTLDIPDLSGNDPARYAGFLLHFEWRYWSIDQLLNDLPVTNMLEMSSGFSFRGLDLTRRKAVHYIDTDLPGLIAVKRPMIDALLAGSQQAGAPSGQAAHPAPAPAPESAAAPGPQGSTAPGHYELQPLDVLDADAFAATVARFPPGPLAIVNEGLLMYLDMPQKEQLCVNIHRALAARGGCWITADVYIHDAAGYPPSDPSTSWAHWRTQHQIEEKKFRDYDEARALFTRMGFKIDKEAIPDYTRLTSLPFLRTIAGPQILDSLRQSGRSRLRTTWRLVPNFA